MADNSDATRKRSLAVTLAVIAVGSGLSWLGRGVDMQRNRYASREDCVRDYSDRQCTLDPPSDNYYGSWHYYGPWYRSSPSSRGPDDPGPGRGGAIGDARSLTAAASARGLTGVESGTRGGFGAHGRVSARGG